MLLNMPKNREEKAGKESIEMNINYAIVIGVVDSSDSFLCAFFVF